MSSYCILLKYASAGDFVYVRELTGHDELSVTETGTVEAIQLLDRLLVDGHETALIPGQADEIATADRDWLLAHIYRLTYGTKIESTISCTACSSFIDLNFNLDDLLAFIQSKTPDMSVKQVDKGIFELHDGSRFRLPRGKDECTIMGLSPDMAEKRLLERCLIHTSPNGDTEEQLQTVMGQVAPVIETEMAAECPDCGKQQMIYFDIQSFLLSALIRERKQITMEIHRLAMAYHWNHNDILSLPRSLRRMYLSFVIAEMGVD